MRLKLEGLRGGFISKIVRLFTSPKFVISLAVLLLALSYGGWRYLESTSADKVFWGMIDNSLQTSSYSRHALQKSGAQSVDQVIQTKTSPEQLVFSDTRFVQTGAESTVVQTENIATPYKDYVRYSDIETSQMGVSGKDLDFSSVLNVWGVSDEAAGNTTDGQLYNNSVLGFIPSGQLTLKQRQALVAKLKESGAFTYQVMETSRSGIFGRPTLSYVVTVNPKPYIAAIKDFAQDVGLNNLENVNPDEYNQAAKMAFTVSVDGWSQLMVKTTQSEGSRTETVTGHNLKKQLPAEPQDAISVDELQARLQAIQ